MSMGNISSLPASIQKDKTSLLKLEKTLKFPMGPTNENPGPILPRAASTAVAVVSKSCPSMDMRKVEIRAMRA